MTARALDHLFAPRSVAVYGASATDAEKLGNKLLANVRAGVPDVICLHPHATDIGGVPARRSLGAPVDLALVSVPAQATQSAVHDAVTSGARVVIVLSSGFGEAGPNGVALQERITDLAKKYGTRLVGPNCMGVVSRQQNGRWLNASYFWSVRATPGGLSFVSQSGAFGGMFLSEARRRELGIARFVSLGNAPDVDIVDALAWLRDDPDTEVIGVFSEGLRDGRAFVEVARTITKDKPLVVLKGGRSDAGARAVAGHTGSLAGSARAYEAGFRRAGVVAVNDSMEFFDALAALMPAELRRHGRRVAVLTISGGPGVLAADAAERYGLDLPEIAAQRQAAIRAYVPPFAATRNPVDLTPQCPASNFAGAIAEVYADDETDAVLVINCGLDIPEFGEGVATAYAATGKPTTAYLLDVPKVAQSVREAGIPCFDSPEQAARGLAVGAQR